MITNFDSLKAVLRGKPLRMAVVAAHEKAVLAAVKEAVNAGWVNAILLSTDTISDEDYRDQADFFKENTTFIETETAAAAAELGAELLRRGEADIIIKGGLQTADFLRPIMDKEKSLIEPGKMLSHVAVVALPNRNKLTIISDSAININPDLAAKEKILENSIRVARCLGYDPPKVAVLSALEVVNPKIPSSVEAAELAIKQEVGRFGNALISGPLALDNALCSEAADTKGIKNNPVAGNADVLTVPDLVSGNILYKSFSLISGYPTAGVVIGAKMPIVLTSRADHPQTKVNSIALACYLYHHYNS